MTWRCRRHIRGMCPRHGSGSIDLLHMSTASTCRPPCVDFLSTLRHVSAVRWMFFVEPFCEQIEQARALDEATTRNLKELGYGQ